MHPSRNIALSVVTTLVPACFSGDRTPHGSQMVALLATHTEIVVKAIDVSCSADAIPRKTALSGRSALLGEYTGTSVGCSSFTSPLAARFESARLVVYVSDKDEIWFELDETRGGGFAVGVDAQRVPSTFTLEVAYHIAGGTGSFLGATGVATLRSTGSLADVTLWSTLAGSISAPIR